MSRYHEVYKSWQRDPESFWADAASDIHWHKPFDKVFDDKAGLYGRWFVGGECNTAYNCLDRHVADVSRRGLAPGAIETVNKGVQLSTIRDPEGNTITFIGNFRVQY